MASGETPKLTYGSYLKIDKLLSCQERNSEVHDEMLFIVVHQAFELWFKLIIHDVESVRIILYKKRWRDISFHTAINRIQRVVQVLRLVVEHFHILETMPPLNFVDFRDKLTGGSGFQSLQFRQIEKLIGVKEEKRQTYEGADYKDKIDPKDKDVLLQYPDEKDGGTLFDVVNSWLATTPGIDDTKFWKEYQKNEKVSDMKQFLDEDEYQKQLQEGHWQLSRKSLQGALLIIMHQDKPEFQQAYQLLSLLMDIDVGLMKWRSTHIHMVHRMIGQKQGTGGTKGTSGYDYLRSTYTDDYKIFRDLFKLATYLRPRNEIPDLEKLSL